MRFLVENGASLTARNKQGRTPLEAAQAIAARRDVAGIIAYLKQKQNVN